MAPVARDLADGLPYHPSLWHVTIRGPTGPQSRSDEHRDTDPDPPVTAAPHSPAVIFGAGRGPSAAEGPHSCAEGGATARNRPGNPRPHAETERAISRSRRMVGNLRPPRDGLTRPRFGPRLITRPRLLSDVKVGAALLDGLVEVDHVIDVHPYAFYDTRGNVGPDLAVDRQGRGQMNARREIRGRRDR